MALVQKQNPRQVTIMILVLLALIIGGGIYVVFESNRQAKVPTSDTIRGRDIPTPTYFNDDFYSSDQFEALRSFKPAAVDIPLAGNPTPFEP